MNKHNFTILIMTVDYEEIHELNKIFSTNYDLNQWIKLKETFNKNKIELLGTSEYYNDKFNGNNLIYYDNDYTDDYVVNKYSKQLNDVFEIYETKLCSKLYGGIAVFGSVNKISIIDTYNIHITLNKFKCNLYEYDCDKKLTNIVEFNDILFMDYDIP